MLNLGSRVDHTSVTTIKVALKQSNLDKLHEHLLNISSPSSPYYGRHWSASDVRKAFAPAQDSIDVVKEWLAASGIESARTTGSGSWLTFESTIGNVEHLLSAEYYEYTEGQDLRIGCDRYIDRRNESRHLLTSGTIVTICLNMSPSMSTSLRQVSLDCPNARPLPRLLHIVLGVSLSRPLTRTKVERDAPSWPGPHPSFPSWGPRPLPWGPWPTPPVPEPSSYPLPPKATSLPQDLRHCAYLPCVPRDPHNTRTSVVPQSVAFST